MSSSGVRSSRKGHAPADAFERGNLALHFQRRASASDGHHLHGVLSDDSNLFHGFQVNGQEASFVLQQHDALFANLPGGSVVFRRAHRAEGLAGVHAGPEHEAQHTAHFVVQLLRRHLSLLDELQVRQGQIIVVVSIRSAVAQSVRPASELQIDAVGDGLTGIVYAAPVGDDRPVEAPLALQDFIQQTGVLAAMLAFVEVVGAHDGPGLPLLHGGLEGGQVNLVERAVVHDDVGVVAVHLVVIQRIVLDADGHAVALHALHIRHHHPGSQIRIFSKVFEVAPVQGRAVDVHPGAQEHVLFAIARLLADAPAVEQGHVGVPGSGQARQRGKGHARVIGPAGLIPLVPQHFRTHAVGAVVCPQLRNAQAADARAAELGLRVNHVDLFP